MARYYYKEEVYHSGLNKYRVVKAETFSELYAKVDALKSQWNNEWERKVAKEKKERERQALKSTNEGMIAYATELTAKYEKIQSDMDTIVSSTAYPSAFDYSQLYDTTEYSEQPPSPPKKFQYPIEPKSDEEKYNQKMSFFTKLIKSKKQAIVDEQKRLYEEDYSKWVAKCRSIDSDYSNQMKKYEEAYAEYSK